jgi:hypothetical protein
LNGGEGKGIMSKLRHLIYNPYSTPNIRFKALEKEQTKSLLLNKLHITSDELPRLHHNGEVSSEDFKVLDNDVITTREMHSNDETTSLYCDCDFNTNTKNFSGLFKDNAIRRRIYPIKKVLVRQFQNDEEKDEWWSFPHRCISSKEFCKVICEFVRETPLDSIKQHMNDSVDVPIPIFHPYQVDQNNPFPFEIIKANQDSFDEWFSTTAQDQSHLPHYTLFQPFEGFTSGYTLDDLFHSYNPNPHSDSYKLGKNNFTERVRDKIAVVISESARWNEEEVSVYYANRAR